MNKYHRNAPLIRVPIAIALALIVTGRLSAGGEDAKAEKAIEAFGGSVKRDDSAKGNPIIHVDLNATKVTDEGLKVLVGLRSLKFLDLTGTKVTDIGLKELAMLTN